MKAKLTFTREPYSGWPDDSGSVLDYVSRDGLIGLEKLSLRAKRKSSLKSWHFAGWNGERLVPQDEIARMVNQQLGYGKKLPPSEGFSSRDAAHHWLTRHVMDRWELWDNAKGENAAAQPRVGSGPDDPGKLRYSSRSQDWGVTYDVPAHAPYYDVFTQKLEGAVEKEGNPGWYEVPDKPRGPGDELSTPYKIMQLEGMPSLKGLDDYYARKRESYPAKVAWVWSYSTRAFGMPEGVNPDGFYEESRTVLDWAQGSPGFAYIKPGRPAVLLANEALVPPVFAKKADAIKSAEEWLSEQWPDGRPLSPGEKDMLRSALERLHATQLGQEKVRDDAGFNNADLQWSKGVVGIWDEVEDDPERLAAVGAVLSSYRNTQLMPEEVRAADVAMALMQDGHAQAREELSGVLKERAKEEKRKAKEAEKAARELARAAARSEREAIKVYSVDPGTLVISFPYDQDLNHLLKRAFPQRRWEADAPKSWTVYGVGRERWQEFAEHAEQIKNIMLVKGDLEYELTSEPLTGDPRLEPEKYVVEITRPTRRSTAFEVRFTTRHSLFTDVKDAVKSAGGRFKSAGNEKYWRVTSSGIGPLLASLAEIRGVQLDVPDDIRRKYLAPDIAAERVDSPVAAPDDGWEVAGAAMFPWLQKVTA
jgi:hypothetical protein